MFVPKLAHRFFICCGFFAANPVCVAQEPSPGGVVETLVVIADPERDSALKKHRVIKSTDEFMPGTRIDVAEVLQGLPGVQVDSRTNLAQDTRISLRGYGARSAFGVRGIDLWVDGAPMSMPDGQGQLSSVMLDSLEFVEVVRGPLAVLYGNGAGGVIAVQTKLPDINSAQLNIATGEQGLQKQQLNVTGRSGNIGAGFAYSRMQQEGERPHARAEREQWGAQLFYESENDLQLRLKHELTDDPLLQDPLGLEPEDWQDDPRQTNPFAEDFNTRKSVRHQQTSLSLRQTHETVNWQIAAWTGARDITQYLGFDGAAISGSGGVVDLAREFDGISTSVSRDMNFLARPLVATLGVEWSQMQDHRRGYVNNMGIAGDLRRNETGDVSAQDIYTVLQWSLTDRIDLYTGARRSEIEFSVDDNFILDGNPDDSGARDYADTSAAAGMRVELNTLWSLSASYGQGFETPTLTEMAYQRNGSGLNTALAAATNQQYETGIFYRNTTTEFSTTFFIIDTDNELVVDQSLGGRTSYINAAATRREGVELWGRVNFTDQWRLQPSLTFIDATYAKGEWNNNQLPGVAREQYQLDVQYLPFNSEQLIFSLGIHKRSAIATSDTNEIFAPGFYRIDAGVEGQVQTRKLALSWWLKTINLTDENYVGSVIVNQINRRAFEPAPGLQFLGGVGVRY